MQLAYVLSLALASAVVAHPDTASRSETTPKSETAQCRVMEKLQVESALAANDTRLADIFKGNQTEIDAFKAKVSSKSTELSTLMSNTTLMTDCPAVVAHDKDLASCGAMKGMEKLQAVAANTTKLDELFKGNQTKISDFQAKAGDAATKLKDLQSNSTLTQFCSVENDKQACFKMDRLQKQAALAMNQTFLDSKFQGNQTKVQNFKDRVAKDKPKLDTMMGNSTLMDTCAKLSKAATTGAKSTQSLAARPDMAGGFITLAAVATAMFML